MAQLGGFKIDTRGRTVTVTVTRTAGGVPVCYTTSSGLVTQSLPAVISSDTAFYFDGPDTLTVSVTVNGVEIASQNGSTVQFEVRSGQFVELAPSVDDGLEAQGVSNAALATKLDTSVASATFLPKVGPTLIPFGDSITAADIGPSSDYNYSTGTSSRGWLAWANVLSGQRVKVLRNAGVGGDTTALMLARVQADVIAYAPGWCIVFGGANDTNADVPAATVISNLTAIITALRAVNIRVILGTLTPTTYANTTARMQSKATVNEWIRHTAPALFPGLAVCDWEHVMGDPTTGAPYTGRTQDGVHPSSAGAIRMGRVLAAVLSNLLPPLAYGGLGAGDPYNLAVGASMVGTTGDKSNVPAATGNLATSWTLFAATPASAVLALSKVTRTDDVPGEWQRMTIGPANATELHLTAGCVSLASGKWAVGSKIRFRVEFQTSGTWSTIDRPIDASILFAGNGGSFFSLYPYDTNDSQPASGILEATAIVPVGTTDLYLVVQTNIAQGVIDIGRVDVRVVT